MAEAGEEVEVGVEEEGEEGEEEEARVVEEEAALQGRDSRGAKVREGDGERRAEVLVGEQLVASVTGAYSKDQKTTSSKMSSSPNLLSAYQCPPAPSAPHARVPSRRR